MIYRSIFEFWFKKFLCLSLFLLGEHKTFVEILLRFHIFLEIFLIFFLMHLFRSLALFFLHFSISSSVPTPTFLSSFFIISLINDIAIPFATNFSSPSKIIGNFYNYSSLTSSLERSWTMQALTFTILLSSNSSIL